MNGQVSKMAHICHLWFVDRGQRVSLNPEQAKGRYSDSARLWFSTFSRLASIDAENILLTRIILFVSALGFLHQITYRMNFQLQGLPH